MLRAVGAKSLADLFQDIPREIAPSRLNLPPGLSEQELLRELEKLGKQNVTVRDKDNYLGAGSYEHFIPSLVTDLAGRAEFVTAYTPYQAEASQGTLATIYEYQTLICQLTGMDIANASLYEGGSALAEAALVAYRNKNIANGKIFISAGVHPEYRQVVKTYLVGVPVEIIEVPYQQGVMDLDYLKDKLDKQTLAVIVQSPNFFGCLEPLAEIVSLTKKTGALSILSAYPLSLGILKDPGSLGFDLVVGEGQSLGNPLSFGGPYLGYLACSKNLLRRIPGRLVGRTKDKNGRNGYVLTLQTREQHIRREKATSNICTNQALNALAACIYLCTLGKQGIQDVARLNAYLSHYARDKMGAELVFSQPFFNEFTIKIPFQQEKLIAEGIIPGLRLERFYPELAGCSLWCVTETKTKQQLDRLAEVLK